MTLAVLRFLFWVLLAWLFTRTKTEKVGGVEIEVPVDSFPTLRRWYEGYIYCFRLFILAYVLPGAVIELLRWFWRDGLNALYYAYVLN